MIHRRKSAALRSLFRTLLHQLMTAKVKRILHIGNLLSTFECFLDQLVVVCRPKGVNWEACQKPMIICGRFCSAKVIEDRLRQLCPVSSCLVAVVLRKCDKIVLFIWIETEISDYVLQEDFPVYVTGRHRKPCPSKHGGVLVVELTCELTKKFRFLYGF